MAAEGATQTEAEATIKPREEATGGVEETEGAEAPTMGGMPEGLTQLSRQKEQRYASTTTGGRAPTPAATCHTCATSVWGRERLVGMPTSLHSTSS